MFLGLMDGPLIRHHFRDVHPKLHRLPTGHRHLHYRAKRIGPELIENNSVSSEMVPVLRWANGAAVAAH